MESLGKIDITTQRLGIDAKPTNYDITPHQGAHRSIGIAPANKGQVDFPENDIPSSGRVQFGRAAPRKNAFDFDDVIVGITDPGDPPNG